MSNRRSLKEVERIFEESSLKLLEKEFTNVLTMMTAIDDNGYYVRQSVNTVLAGNTPRIFGASNPHTINNIHRWLDINEKTFELLSSKFVKSNEKLSFKCCVDGHEWRTTWNVIVVGKGCPVCGMEKCKPIKMSTSEFVNKANKIHNNLYDYSLVEYKDYSEKIEIICKIHGSFFQTPAGHLSGMYGCRECAYENHDGAFNIVISERNKEKWISLKAKVYVIRIFNDFESFYKVGITTTTLEKRFSSLPYEYEVISLYHTNRYDATHVENFIHKKHKHLRYRPGSKFGGHTECFSDILDDILSSIEYKSIGLEINKISKNDNE